MDPSRGSPAGDDDEAVHRRLLAAAAAKFPALISEDRTFCGRITETESSPSNGSHARVWLSSAAMISTSIAPGSIVSVLYGTYVFTYYFKAHLVVISICFYVESLH